MGLVYRVAMGIRVWAMKNVAVLVMPPSEGGGSGGSGQDGCGFTNPPGGRGWSRGERARRDRWGDPASKGRDISCVEEYPGAV
jgi:hypothetical protein